MSYQRSVRRIYIDRFFIQAFNPLSAGLRVLDIGGHKATKRGKFEAENYDIHITYVNLTSEKGTDVIGDAAVLPYPKNSFDIVICGELLEHVPDPRLVLQEAYRVLKPTGRLLATVPFMFPIHADPYDFGRYTDYYWLKNLADIGFQKTAVTPQGLYYSVMASYLEYFFKYWHLPSPFNRPFHWFTYWIIVAPCKWIAFQLDKHPKRQSHPHLRSVTTGYGINAQK